jgi:hypothetical protein
LWRWWNCGIKWHGGPNLTRSFWKHDWHHGWKKGLEIFFSHIESHGILLTIRVIMVWCVRCGLKYLITSQSPLSGQGRHPKHMINKKHANNIP